MQRQTMWKKIVGFHLEQCSLQEASCTVAICKWSCMQWFYALIISVFQHFCDLLTAWESTLIWVRCDKTPWKQLRWVWTSKCMKDFVSNWHKLLSNINYCVFSCSSYWNKSLSNCENRLEQSSRLSKQSQTFPFFIFFQISIEILWHLNLI